MSYFFSACPHDSAIDPEKWHSFLVYLEKHGISHIKNVRYTDFSDFASHFPDFSFVYAHPVHAVELQRNYHFLPVAIFADTYDEAVIIGKIELERYHPSDILKSKVACIPGSPSCLAFLLELRAQQIDLKLNAIEKQNYPDVLMSVTLGETDFGIILKDVWEKMIGLKNRVRVVHETSTQKLVHVFMLSSELKDYRESIKNIFTNMNNDPDGKELLERFGISAIIPFSDEQMALLSKNIDIIREVASHD